MLKGQPFVALRSEAGLAIKGQVVTVLHGLIGRSGRGRNRVWKERHVAVCRVVLQTVALYVRQVLKRRGAHGGAGRLQW